MEFQFPLGVSEMDAGPQLWTNPLMELIAPWTPLLAWIVFWLFAVNWVKLREVMIRGGFIGVVLIGLVAVLVWGTVAPPSGQTHHMFGLKVANYVGKTVYVTLLICIMYFCGIVQLSGLAPACCRFPEEAEEPVAEPHGHH